MKVIAQYKNYRWYVFSRPRGKLYYIVTNKEFLTGTEMYVYKLCARYYGVGGESWLDCGSREDMINKAVTLIREYG